MNSHNFWMMRRDVDVADYQSRNRMVDNNFCVVNEVDVSRAVFDLQQTRSVKIAGDPLLPEGFPRPVVSLPALDFAPDYFEMDSCTLVSRRFRDALAQPANVVQYWPVDISHGSAEAYAQDYKLFRVLAWQPVMDMERSIYDKEDSYNRRTGEQFVDISYIKRFFIRDDLVPCAEVFRSAENSLYILTADAVAERVMKAGCTGVSFEEPETIGLNGREPRRYRTAEGIGIFDP